MPRTWFKLVIHILNSAYTILLCHLCSQCRVHDSQLSSIFSIPRTRFFFVIHVLNAAYMILICHQYAKFRVHYPSSSSMFSMPRTWFSIVIHILHIANTILLCHPCSQCRVHDSNLSSIFLIPRAWFFFVIYMLNSAYIILLCHPCSQCRVHVSNLSSIFRAHDLICPCRLRTAYLLLSRLSADQGQAHRRWDYCIAVFSLSTYTVPAYLAEDLSTDTDADRISSFMERPPPFKCPKNLPTSLKARVLTFYFDHTQKKYPSTSLNYSFSMKRVDVRLSWPDPPSMYRQHPWPYTLCCFLHVL